MRQLLIIAAATGGLSFTFGGSTAVAGYCGSNAQPISCQRPAPMPIAPPCIKYAPPMAAPPVQVPGCKPDIITGPSPVYTQDPVMISSTQSMDYLRSIKFYNSPHVNIMRVHGQNSGIGLHDAPTGFTGGCHPSSTSYCGQQSKASAPAPIAQPQPFIAPPLPVIEPAPVAVVQPQPQQYGSTELVRGTAYLPTSHVNRDYNAAMAVLNSGPIPARPAVNGGQVPHPSMFSGAPNYNGNPNAGYAPAPAPGYGSAPMPPAGPAYGPVPGNWQQVSGPTMVDGLPATQVVCRNPAPMPAPVTCVRQSYGPLALAGAPHSQTRYGSN